MWGACGLGKSEQDLWTDASHKSEQELWPNVGHNFARLLSSGREKIFIERVMGVPRHMVATTTWKNGHRHSRRCLMSRLPGVLTPQSTPRTLLVSKAPYFFRAIWQSMSEWMLSPMLVRLETCSLATSQTISHMARSEYERARRAKVPGLTFFSSVSSVA